MLLLAVPRTSRGGRGSQENSLKPIQNIYIDYVAESITISEIFSFRRKNLLFKSWDIDNQGYGDRTLENK